MAALIIVWVGPAVRAQVSMEPAEVSFGRFKSAMVAGTQWVTLKNEGKAAVAVKAIQTGCGCVRPVLSGPIAIPIGQSVRVKFVVAATPQQIGETWYPLSVLLAGEENSIIRGRIGFDYRPDVSVIPATINIDADSANIRSDMGVGSGSVVLRDWTESKSHPLKVTSVSTSSHFMQYAMYDVAFVETTGNCGHYVKIFAVLPPGWPVGPINEKMFIHTDDPEFAQIEVPITGMVRGPVNVSPPVLLLSGMKAGAEFHRKVVLTAEEPIRIERIWSSSTVITTRQTLASDLRTVVLEVDGRIEQGYTTNGLYDQDVRVEFLRPRRYTQAIRISAFVNEAGAVSAPVDELSHSVVR